MMIAVNYFSLYYITYVGSLILFRLHLTYILKII